MNREEMIDRLNEYCNAQTCNSRCDFLRTNCNFGMLEDSVLRDYIGSTFPRPAQLNSWKMKCIDVGVLKDVYTKNKIYHVENGSFIPDTGVRLHISHEILNSEERFTEWQKHSLAKWELVKDGVEVEKTEIKIKDSGERRQFESGAVRDIQDGKGRCDLMPLGVISVCMNDSIMECFEQFKINGNIDHLYEALALANIKLFGSHANAFLEVSKQFEDGARKYGERNWQKGIPVKSFTDSAVRHYLKHISGMTDEPHDRALIWNIVCCIWTCENKPELNEYGGEMK